MLLQRDLGWSSRTTVSLEDSASQALRDLASDCSWRSCSPSAKVISKRLPAYGQRVERLLNGFRQLCAQHVSVTDVKLVYH